MSVSPRDEGVPCGMVLAVSIAALGRMHPRNTLMHSVAVANDGRAGSLTVANDGRIVIRIFANMRYSGP